MNERPDLTEETKTLDNGESFFSEALTGSGTIDPETGTYGPPKPDPTVLRGVDGQSTSGGRTVLTPSGDVPANADATDAPAPEPKKATAPTKRTDPSAK